VTSTADVQRVEAAAGQGDGQGDVWTLFVVTWAAAVLFHLAGNPTLAPQWGRLLLGAAAIALIARPRNAWLSLSLAAAVLVNVWLEAPLLGNHWALHGFVSLIVLAGVISARGHRGAAMARSAGPVRLTVLAFYAFAAFAKLNTDFFDPSVSCASFYLRESIASWGAAGVAADLPAWAERAAAFAVAGVELAIPVLLVVRRSRNAGVLVALVFHYVLAFDRTHQFFDFSSVLAALFLLFLDPLTVRAGLDRLRLVGARIAARWPSGPELVRLGVLLVLVVVALFASGPASWGAPGTLREIGVGLWLVYGAVLIVGVAIALANEPGSGGRRLVPSGTPVWLLAVPVLAVLNGLTPYLEIKSGYGWNMYSNLAVVDGESNHLVVSSGLPVADAHDRLVRITDSDDGALEFYVLGEWLVPERELLDYLADRPDVSVRGTVDGHAVLYEGGEVDARPSWQQKFQVFRAVDAAGPTGCQPSFGPAR
jgi:hypothetical protein